MSSAKQNSHGEYLVKVTAEGPTYPGARSTLFGKDSDKKSVLADIGGCEPEKPSTQTKNSEASVMKSVKSAKSAVIEK